MSKQTIGEFLSTQRKAKGYTQQYVADMMGISNRTLSAWETNKAYPDILTLPALAELYGVTADEIIKGERNPVSAECETEISEKAQAKIYKSRLARNSSGYTALLSAGLCAAAAFALGVSVLQTVRVEWLGILLIVLGLVASVTVFTLLVIKLKNTISSAGVFPDSENTPLESKFIVNAVNQCVRVSNIIGVVWLCLGIVSGFLWVIVNIAERIETVTCFAGFMLFFGIFAAVAFIILVTANLIKIKTLKNCGTAEHIKILKHNSKLFGLCSISLIPFVVFVIALSVLSVNPPYSKQELFSGNEESFKNYMHTAIVNDSLFSGEDIELLIGKTLNIPDEFGEEPQPVGEGFYVCATNKGDLEVLYNYHYNDKIIQSHVLYAERLKIEGSSAKIYNVRYSDCNIETEYKNGEYTVYELVSENISYSTFLISLTASFACVAVGTVIYSIKRKKLKITM